MTTTLSVNGVEFCQFFHGGGTTNESFQHYFKALTTFAKAKYPRKKLVFLLDNLW